MKHIYTFFIYAAFFQFLILLALFNGWQISLPLPAEQAKQAQIDNARAVMASSAFDVIDPKMKRK